VTVRFVTDEHIARALIVGIRREFEETDIGLSPTVVPGS
jgi:hypothetical protein